MDADNRKPQFEDIERWLDTALRDRVNAEPRNGLEERVLVRLASQPPPRIVWWPVMSAVAVVLAVAVALVVMYSRRQEQIVVNRQLSPAASRETPAQANSVTHNPPTKSGQARVPRMLASTTKQRAVPRARVHAELESLPKLATFPGPRPETAEERMLARLGSRRDSYEIANMSNGLPLRGLSIPEIRIEPLEGTPPDNAPQE